MPSPFPGMNPYLEGSGLWPMFHTQLLSGCQQHLVAQVRPRYFVRLESRVYVREAGDPDRRFAGTPALSVTGPTTAPEGGSTTAVLTPPAYTTEPTAIDDAEATTRYLEVVDRADNAVVTVVELLSPANKYAGPDRLQYLAKRRELLRSPAHFIELDLLRGGPRVLAGPLPPADYYALVYRAADRPRAGVWPWRVRDPIPLVPVPLRGADADATLNLKVVLDAVYDAGGYADAIYDGPPEPRLTPADQAWANGYLPPPP